MSTPEEPPKPRHLAIFSRHSKALYQNDARVLGSENPEGSVSLEDQITPDLSAEGQAMALEEAEKFFGNLNPATDSLFFVSSSQTRALETAAIYARVAKEKGFTVLQPKNVRSNFAKRIGSEDIRVLQNLSLRKENVLLNDIFTPNPAADRINWEGVHPEVREQWERARAIVLADDKGSWGANFYAHSKEAKKVLPKLADLEDLYEQEFKNLIKLTEFGLAKAEALHSGGSVKILAFGHENYLGFALNRYFDEHAIGNCEAVTLEQTEGGLVMERRGVQKEIEE